MILIPEVGFASHQFAEICDLSEPEAEEEHQDFDRSRRRFAWKNR